MGTVTNIDVPNVGLVSFQRHHLLPRNVARNSEVVDMLIEANLWNNNNRSVNMIGLPNSDVLTGITQHLGPHTQYSAWYTNILGGFETELSSLSGAARDLRLVEISNELVGINNYLKSEFLDPNSPLALMVSSGGTSGQWDDITMDVIRGSDAYQLGRSGVAIPVWIDSDSVGIDPAYSAASGLDADARSAELQDYRNRLANAYDSLDSDAKARLAAGGISERLTAATLIDEIASGNKSASSVSSFLNGTGPKVMVVGGVTLFNPSLAQAAVGVMDGLGRGSEIIDGASLLLLGYAFQQSGAINDISVSSLMSVVTRSNIAFAASHLDNLALGVGQELIIAGVATLLGVGILWKGYEIYQSLDGLTAALAIAAEYGDSELIDRLNTMVEGAQEWLDSRYGSNGSGSGTGSGSTYVPEHQELAELLLTSFDESVLGDGGQTMDNIGSAILQFLRTKTDDHPTILFPLANFGPEDIEQLMDYLHQVAAVEGVPLRQLFEAAILEQSDLFEENPALFAMFNPTHCFAAGTLIEMADGSHKVIEDIRQGDSVLSYNAMGRLVPGRVSRTKMNRVTQVIDFWGTKVTPGHVFLCGDGKFKGQHVPLIDILRSDGAIVLRNGDLMRASTGDRVGSDTDRCSVWVATGDVGRDGQLDIRQARKLRMGQRLITTEGQDVSLAQVISAAGASVDAEGMIVSGDGQKSMFHWTMTFELPNPESYVLDRSNVTLTEIYAANEWDDLQPRLPLKSALNSITKRIVN